MRINFSQQVLTKFIAIVLVSVLGSTLANAVTVYFGDLDRGPGDTLQIGGVTVSGDGGQPATVLASGLGIDGGLGPIDEVNRQMHYSSGQIPDVDTGPAEGIRFSVDGIINSITIVPQFRIYSSSGDLLPDKLAFEIYCSVGVLAGPSYYYLDPSNVNPITFPSLINPDFAHGSDFLNVSSDWGQFLNFMNYREQHLAEEQTFQLGFTVLSLDYTPVPEPGTTALLGIGVLALSYARRQVNSSKWHHFETMVTTAVCIVRHISHPTPVAGRFISGFLSLAHKAGELISERLLLR